MLQPFDVSPTTRFSVYMIFFFLDDDENNWYGVDIQVKWFPYKDLDHAIIPEDIKNNLILRTSKTILICFGKAERHLPDRCLRQFGMLQHIPEDVQKWERKIPAVDQGVDLSTDVELGGKGKMRSEIKEWLERRVHILEGNDGVDENTYMDWYERITRKYVGRPESLESEFQRIVSLCFFFLQVDDV